MVTYCGQSCAWCFWLSLQDCHHFFQYSLDIEILFVFFLIFLQFFERIQSVAILDLSQNGVIRTFLHWWQSIEEKALVFYYFETLKKFQYAGQGILQFNYTTEVDCMLLTQVPATQWEASVASGRNLMSALSQILKKYSVRGKQKESYFFASLDSSLVLKIQFKFLKNQAFMRGSLLSVNGKPVFVPEMYRDPLVRALESSLRISARFFFSKDIDGLLMHYNFSFNSQSAHPENILLEHFKPLIQALPQIHNQLASFGVAKKLNNAYRKSLAQRLTLVSQVVNILTSKKSQGEQHGSSMPKQGKGSVFNFCSEILEVEKSNLLGTPATRPFSSSQGSVKKGGYFEVQKKFCKIVKEIPLNGSKDESMQELAVKKLRSDQEKTISSQTRLKKQLKILHQIQDPKHFLAYFIEGGENKIAQPPQIGSKLHMEFIDQTLDDYINGKVNTMGDKLNFCDQLIQAVKVLHKCGIVHRDLKPQNLLIKTVRTNGNRKQRQMKIIDFGESVLTTDKFPESKEDQDDLLGSTIPYSPLECYTMCVQGFNRKEIDLWSVGVILHEIMHGKNPLSYSRCFGMGIYKGWRMPDEFSLFPPLGKKYGMRIIQFILCLVSLNSVCVNQAERISLEKMAKIMGLLQQFWAKTTLI